MGEEPLEILNTAKKQIGIKEGSNLPQKEIPENTSEDPEQNNEGLKKQVAIADMKNLESLQNEMREIRRQKLFESLLARIQSDEKVPVEEFQELSFEQKDVLKAQIEATKNRSQNIQQKELIEPESKKSRKFGGFGKRKNAAEKQATRVEMPLPPSG